MSKLDLAPDLIESLRAASRVAVLTGAGVSAESGVPTFRDAQTGLWAKYSPEELATPGAFLRDPKLVWEWYQWRRELVAKAEPNAGHFALAELERRIEHFTLITQNVDSLHREAGSTNIVELHGNLTRTRCFDCRAQAEKWSDEEIPPRCEKCGGRLRPDVVWFGEPLPPDAMATAIDASARCDVFLCVGTSALVQPAASLPFEALRAKACVVEINPQPTPLTPYATHVVAAPAGEALPALLAAMAG